MDTAGFVISVISIVISVFSLGLMIWLHGRTNNIFKQIHDITNNIVNLQASSASITKETNDIAKELETNTSIAARVKKVFQLEGGPDVQSKYKVIYPSKYEVGRPMTLIYHADFYAIHIISVRLGEDRIELKEVERASGTNDTPTIDTSFYDNLCAGKAVFICAPQTNPALDYVLPYLRVNDYDIAQWKSKINLPCWFINSREDAIQDNSSNEYETPSTVKRIYVCDDQREECIPIDSPAEILYKMSRKSKLDKHYIVKDYGIFARLTKENGNNYTIIAGIHQYGTWIVADFLDTIVRKGLSRGQPNDRYMEVFESGNDFIAIIEGIFNTQSLKIEHSSVSTPYIWTKKTDDDWSRVR